MTDETLQKNHFFFNVYFRILQRFSEYYQI